MKHLYKIFHEQQGYEFEPEYLKRINSPSTTLFGFKIQPMNQPRDYELYYLPTDKIIELISKVHNTTRRLERIYYALPSVAQNQFINECLIEELYNTNDLEGVRSTREEIARSTRDVKQNIKSKRRFKSMIKVYLNLLNGEISFPEKPEDIRSIYDDIASGEIEKSELPDGKIFREEATYIMKKSGSTKVIHTGLTPESKIYSEMQNLINFMNNDNDGIPRFIKVAVGHYYFGYIHPFYDGNGRTSRFISSMYLSDELGNIGSLSLSRACNKYRSNYLESFETTNSIKNAGEMNCFIESFLEIILKAITEMLHEMQVKDKLLDIAIEKIKNEPKLNEEHKKYREIMFVIAQNYFFDSATDKGITVKELADETKSSPTTIRKIVDKLSEVSLVEITGQKPKFITIKQKYFES